MANLHLIKDIAKNKQISIRKIAVDVGISDVALHSLIKNGSTNTTTLEKIANVLGVSAGVFFDGYNEDCILNDNSDRDDVVKSQQRTIENLSETVRNLTTKK
jgi:transcriptional regulator with XRE-family HTH domain